MRNNGLKRGEKVLFAIAGLFLVFAVISFAGLETYRIRSGKKLYVATTHFDFSPEGLEGSKRFRDLGCSSCHRAVRNGTNNGVNLDGLGSRRTRDYIYNFLRDPEATYGTATVDHGPGKGAAFVATLPETDLHSLTTFLSELKATQGSPDARLPVDGRSGFIDDMVKIWAPSSWKSQYHDVRDEANAAAAQQKKAD